VEYWLVSLASSALGAVDAAAAVAVAVGGVAIGNATVVVVGV